MTSLSGGRAVPCGVGAALQGVNGSNMAEASVAPTVSQVESDQGGTAVASRFSASSDASRAFPLPPADVVHFNSRGPRALHAAGTS